MQKIIAFLQATKHNYGQHFDTKLYIGNGICTCVPPNTPLSSQENVRDFFFACMPSDH